MLDDEEKYLAAMMDDPSGIELAEFLWVDEEQPDRCFRVWDFQWTWYHNESIFQIDQAGRSLGKSVGIQMRGFAFPFCFPGQEMLITAPELNHLRPVTDKIENLFLSVRMAREMLPRTKGAGINHQPQFQARFINGARIISRLPNRDGKGVKTCVAAGTLISTARGQIPVEEVHTGDQALTDQGRYMPVRHVYEYPDTESVEVAGAGHKGLVVSLRHTFLARRNADPQRTRKLGRPTWLHVDSDELARHYWASPTMFPQPELPDLPAGVEDGVELLRLAGRYVADGTFARANVSFVDDEPGIAAIETICKTLGLTPRRRPHDNAVCTVVNSTALARWLNDHFGHLANGKKIPPWLLGAPRAAREAFLSGYLAGDGHWSQAKQRWEASTASKALAIGVKLLAQSLGLNTSYSWVDPKVTHIGGRKLKAPPQRSHRVQISDHGHGIFESGMLWGKLRTSVPAGQQLVYDLVVAEDHSYIGDGIVHLGSAFLPDGKEA